VPCKPACCSPKAQRAHRPAVREQNETLVFLAPLVADQALVATTRRSRQLLRGQVKKAQTDRFVWTDKEGKQLIAQDEPDKLDAPAGSCASPPSSSRTRPSR
jgi:hypothetical protein